MSASKIKDEDKAIQKASQAQIPMQNPFTPQMSNIPLASFLLARP